MLFNSIEYLIFLPLVFLCYWLLNQHTQKQNVLLLFASYCFYGWWDWRFLTLILLSSLLDYGVALAIEKNNDQQRKRKRYLLVSLFSNLGLLGVFKYFDFFSDSFQFSMSLLGWKVNAVTLDLILPVGISFYTFQTMSYTLDVYRRTIKPTHRIVSFLTYVSFFPQLVAGPIERASNLIPQIEGKREFDLDFFRAGLFQLIFGLFRKIVIADNLAIYVDSVYGNGGIHSSSTLIIATVFYAFQIYFDFAGYSDMAIGAAKMLGFQFERNFNMPYFSKSLTEFWRRWHISLSSWLKDYLYISLGGNRKGVFLTYRNLLLTMLLGGLWHGSTWNFVIWGAIHGVMLGLEKFIFARFNLKNFNAFGYVYTFTLVLISWVFFRAADFDSAIRILANVLDFKFEMPFIGNINTFLTGLLVLGLGVIFDFYLVRTNTSLEEYGAKLSSVQMGGGLAVLIVFICLFYSTSDNFIYFQF